ncbi:mitochondrial carrier domain-containing protein [Gaertneriomyces semiglobifer]|nr:mitochondrial carrier domain-containing protein [Gaertneriomyces semiglobifer]
MAQPPISVSETEPLLYSLSSSPAALAAAQLQAGDAEKRYPLARVVVCGAMGGLTADSIMHVLDTVKTRLQRDGTLSRPRYSSSTIRAFRQIHTHEGLRGLYAGFPSAFLGSLLSTSAYFASYEYLKRYLIDTHHVPPGVSYFIAGGVGDVVASVFYVPSEVIKTRMQLQGRYNNPYSGSQFNYRSDTDALKSVWRSNGIPGFYHGYKATLIRDVPFTALQFTIYELSLPLIKEPLLAGFLAGTLSGYITTPLDVVKTYLQTSKTPSVGKFADTRGDTHQVWRSFGEVLRGIYATRGVRGLWSGWAPRCCWTGFQSCIMFLGMEGLLKGKWFT